MSQTLFSSNNLNILNAELIDKQKHEILLCLYGSKLYIKKPVIVSYKYYLFFNTFVRGGNTEDNGCPLTLACYLFTNPPPPRPTEGVGRRSGGEKRQ